ncbi:MAG: AsmA family protein [Roseobacter sp.]
MKWIYRLFGLLIAVVVCLIAAVFFIPTERLARIATDQMSAAMGRDVSIDGEVSLSFWPVLGVSVDGLEIGSADWATRGPMFEAAHAAIGIDAKSLLSGNVKITNIEANNPVVRLEQKQDGRANWLFSTEGGAANEEIAADSDAETGTEDAPAGSSFTIEQLNVTDATVIYDAEGSELVSLSGVQLSLDWPDPSGAAEIAMELHPGPSLVTIGLIVEDFDGFLAGGISVLDISLKTPEGQMSLTGRASISGSVDGDFSFATDDTSGFIAGFGLPNISLPPKLGQKINLNTGLTLTPELDVALRNLKVDLGGNVLTGDVDLSLDGTPLINARFDAGDLDLSFATTEDTSGGEKPSGDSSASKQTADGWSTDPIDASGLAAFNGGIALSANSIDLGTFQLGQTLAVLQNDKSRMVFELREVNAYSGKITGEFVVNNRSGLSVGGKMKIASIQMQPLLEDAIEVDRLTGQGDLNLSFLGSGQNVDAIMKSLSGDGDLAIGKGTIEGLNLDRLLSGGSLDGTTIFDDLTATWRIKEGVLSNSDLLLQLKNYQASGKGVVGLGQRNIDYTFTPVALRANEGNGVAIPVILSGPWSDVSIRPDIEAALDLRFDEEKEALEERAKEEVLDSLGVKPSEGQSTKDAIEEKAKDKLLRKLFD